MDPWENLMRRLGLPPTPELGQALRDRYSEPHRVFHTREHLAQVVGLLEEIGADDRLVLAAWYHDAVYQPGSLRNERRSAFLARTQLAALGVKSTDIDFVERAILATSGHAANDADIEPLLDADLAILGSNPNDYDRYASAIRSEFRAVPTLLFRRGRTAFLRSMLDRPAIFSTPAFAHRFEAAAHQNLAREWKALNSKD